MRSLLLVTSLTVLTGACATKGYVNSRIGQVDTRVDSLTGAVEETQARTTTAEGRISDVDQKAGTAQSTADGAAASARTADERAAAARSTADAVGERAEALDAASRRLVFEVVISEDQGNYKFNSTDLPDEAKARIDDMVNQLKAEPKAVFFEIEGHTDSTGPEGINEELGLERADAVKRYLYEEHQIPLHKINIISFGEANPVAPNTTRDGRAKNRRVVIKVLA